jgi:TM2 domain-containing membrane protein YozV
MQASRIAGQGDDMQQVSNNSVSGDARAMMLYEANKKSAVVAYLLWWFLGFVGGHRFYAGRSGSAIAQLLLCIVSIALMVVYIGFLSFLALAIWWLVDAFLIPGWIRNLNSLLAVQLGSGG